MGKYKEINGCLIELSLSGAFDIVAQGNNCFCTQSAGLAPQFVKAFGSDKFTMENGMYKGDINKLGTIDYQTGKVIDGKFEWAKSNNQFEGSLTVINAYTQFMYGTNHIDGVSKPLDYEALTLCLRKINHIFKGKHIGLPLIGCHLAGGVWDYTLLQITKKEIDERDWYLFRNGMKKDVKTIIKEELKDMNVTIVHYDKK